MIHSKNGVFEFELLYDIGNTIRNENGGNLFSYIPQTINFENDKEDFLTTHDFNYSNGR